MRRAFLLISMVAIIAVFPGILTGQASLEKVVLDERTIKDPLKSWSITFTAPVNKGTVKKQNFYIIDKSQKKLQTKLRLSDDGTKVTITPETSYKEGVQYYLYIKGNVKTGKSTFLNEHTVLPFKLVTKESTNKVTSSPTKTDNRQVSTNTSKDDPSPGTPPNSNQKDTKLVSTQTKRHSHFVEISVKVSDQVAKVKAGSNEFEYKGNNQFVLYKPDLKKGEKLTIKGYSLSNKVLETKEIVIP
ncbi:Ig-like domain-containing protein [Bacillus sp. DTU_2020_1000418_1_SI_GHA_SEK_038]|uniref:Ig-like domain-containing protein n=1 Tax=Bacillus sp. DTU_2020_1000418_1_SI_GHA_SEK_038 TaxID=3077585 RepID=UPI0028E28C51|nr:Ig-like domain-containing protein [Bacillus sp. DTU_2020_1000418_1_SI_GHA_SEK_038]WNS75223.1 Ig-like domain-containing protein [Bacillus sp. DTU_2020_1000418_1_SI_GHA_SEK_038]